MESSFGKRLFRLFLLFSLIPAVLLALVGYYLASEHGLMADTRESLSPAKLAGYYNDYLFARIDKDIEGFMDTRDAGTLSSDFAFEVTDGVVEFIKDPGDISASLAAKLVEAAANRPHGFVESDGRFFQYCKKSISDNDFILGGLAHDAKYADLLQSIQADHAEASSSRALLSNYIHFLAVLFIVLALLTGGFAYYFSSRISKSLAYPLLELSDASQKIAGGDFQQQVNASGAGEVQTLIDNFNAMARQLGSTTARLARSERVAAWRHVARRFAHELKNPLQPILVSLYRIEKALKSSQQYRQVEEPLKAASQEVKHLTELAERFSQLAKLPPPSLQTINVNEQLQSIANLYKEHLADYHFSLELPHETIHAQVDPTYFREAVHNLLQNAVDASDKGGRIILALHGADARAVVTVRDFGKGMSNNVLSSARIPYFTTKEKGSGLGLAVVEKIIDELGGDLSIHSKERQGTTVTVSLPRPDKDARQNTDS